MTNKPVTLGDKLTSNQQNRTQRSLCTRLQDTLSSLLNFSLMSGTIALLLWILTGRAELNDTNALMIAAAAIVVRLIFALTVRTRHYDEQSSNQNRHPLLKNGQHRFMSALRLDAKTAIIDGSNIYHFGDNNGTGARPLRLIANQLRDEGYRIVCFFDANIFFTLSERGAFPKFKFHSTSLLGNIFGLAVDEIYVVPSGVQADRYILDSLKHLPISFAVTNDKYRDYSTQYPTVMKDNLWRKGVSISEKELKLHHHQFQKPVQL